MDPGVNEGELMDLELAIQNGMLGFCMCGNPPDLLLYVLGGLELIAERMPHSGGMVEARFWIEDKINREVKYFGSSGAKWLFAYWADKEGFTEHGSSVTSCWLSAKGEKLLNLLKEWKEKEWKD